MNIESYAVSINDTDELKIQLVLHNFDGAFGLHTKPGVISKRVETSQRLIGTVN